MAIEHITDHFHQSLLALIPPLWAKPNVASLLRSYIRQVQLLEDDALTLLTAFNIDTADAARLAVLGRVVGQFNAGWDLETYRNVIRGKIATNRSRGTEDDLINVIRLIIGGDPTIDIFVVGAATALISIAAPFEASELVALVFLLPKARAGGVRLQLLISGSVDEEDTFLWNDVWALTEEWGGAIVL